MLCKCVVFHLNMGGKKYEKETENATFATNYLCNDC